MIDESFAGINLPSVEKQGKTAPLRGLIAVNTLRNTQYGIGQVGAWISKDGIVSAFRSIGGNITMSGMKGKVSCYRTPLLSLTKVKSKKSADGKTIDVAPGDVFIEKVRKSVVTLTRLMLNDFVINRNVLNDHNGNSIDLFEREWASVLDQLYIRSGFDLNRWYTLDAWSTIVRDIYEQFDKGMIGGTDDIRREQFIVGSFADIGAGKYAHIPGSFDIQGGGEVYVVPPKNSFTQVTRVYVNIGIWVAICELMGYAPKMAGPLYELFDANYTNGRIVDAMGLLSLLASEGNSPVEGLEDVNLWDSNLVKTKGLPSTSNSDVLRITRIVWDLVSKMLMLKIFELVRQATSIEDVRFDTEYEVFYRGIPDAQFSEMMRILNANYADQHVNVPSGSLGHKREIHYLPIMTNKSTGYQTIQYGQRQNHDTSEYNGQPAVGFSEIYFGISYHQGKVTSIGNYDGKILETGDFDAETFQGLSFNWLKYVNIHASPNQQVISYNRITGDIQISNNQEGTAYFGIIYPSSLNYVVPITNAFKLEERHWPLLYKKFYALSPIIVVGSGREQQIYGIKSIFGPRAWLFNSSNLVHKSKEAYETLVKGIVDEVTKHLIANTPKAKKVKNVE